MNPTLNTSAATEIAPWVARLARLGYSVKALLYITIGLIAAQAALGRGGRATDTWGALLVVHDVTFGRVMLLVSAAKGLLPRPSGRTARSRSGRRTPRIFKDFGGYRQ